MMSKGCLFNVLPILVLCLCTTALTHYGHDHHHHHNGGATKIRLNDVLQPGQKWINEDRTVVITIEKVNTNNATFAATYHIISETNRDIFPIRGEFDPDGESIGWVVSYWNQYKNDHALGAWAGYLVGEDEESTIFTTRLITHNGDPADVTVGFDRFRRED